MNVSRRAANGKVDPNDKMNKSQVYITLRSESNLLVAVYFETYQANRYERK